MSLLRELIIATGLGAPDLKRIIHTAPARYKVYYIPKKNGGLRQIAHPSRELKLLQRLLLDRYLYKYPVHPAAMAYVRGRNIYDNARHHVGNRVLLKLDFESFFPSIKVADWRKFLEADHSQIFLPEDIDITTHILFWGSGSSIPRCLSIGAPTSPILSNILLFDLDTRIDKLAREFSIHYSRYADDITLSAPSFERVVAFEKLLSREVTRTRNPRLKFNEAKRGVYTKGQRRMVTGLIVTPTGDVSIGRSRKRAISAMLHRFSLGELDMEQIGILKGLLGFTVANEPAFIGRMREKYGDAVVTTVLRTHIPSRHERP